MAFFKDFALAAFFSMSWAVVSSGLILLNKYILSTLDFHYPLALSRRDACGHPAVMHLHFCTDALPRALAPLPVLHSPASAWDSAALQVRCLSTCSRRTGWNTR